MKSSQLFVAAGVAFALICTGCDMAQLNTEEPQESSAINTDDIEDLSAINAGEKEIFHIGSNAALLRENGFVVTVVDKSNKDELLNSSGNLLLVDGSVDFDEVFLQEVIRMGNPVVAINEPMAIQPAIRDFIFPETMEDGKITLQNMMTSDETAFGYFQDSAGRSSTFQRTDSDLVSNANDAYEWAQEVLGWEQNIVPLSPHPAYGFVFQDNYVHAQEGTTTGVSTILFKLGDDGDNQRDFYVAQIQLETNPGSHYVTEWVETLYDVDFWPSGSGYALNEYEPTSTTHGVDFSIAFSNNGVASGSGVVSWAYSIPHIGVTNLSDVGGHMAKWKHSFNWLYGPAWTTNVLKPGVEFMVPNGINPANIRFLMLEQHKVKYLSITGLHPSFIHEIVR
ncbi:MAG: hypothetical protein Tsb0020_21290 [Haliangiales bacterium]